MANVIILAYANDNSDSLKHLQRENQTIYDYLQFKNQGEINVRNLENVTYDKLMKEFAAHKDDIILFHFSGHAAPGKVFFEDEKVVNAGGLAALMQMAPNLELVFLNGCGTGDQVAAWHGETKLQIPPAGEDKGVKRVIATSTPVFDSTATDFAIYFYSALCRYWNVGQAFDYAKTFVMAGDKSYLFPDGPARQVGSRQPGIKAGFPWGMYYKKVQKEDTVDYYLPLDEYALPDKKMYAQVEGEYKPNDKLIEKIGSKGLIIYNHLMAQISEQEKKDKVFNAEVAEFAELQNLYSDYTVGGAANNTALADRVINMLPTPLAGLLRQMISEAIEIKSNPGMGYESLLDLQLRFHGIMIKLCSFTMLSDLFNLVDQKEVTMNKVQHQYLNEFFSITRKESDSFDYVTFIKIMREVLASNTANPFVKEYLDLVEKEDYESSFFDSHMLLRGIRLRRKKGALGASVVGFCQSVEDELIKIFDRVYFILRYKLLVVKNVEAIRSRTISTKTFNHKILLLRQNMSGLPDLNELSNIDDYTETHSVIVVKGLNRIIDYLSLSPFVIDKNVLTGDDNTELFFFSHNDKGMVFESIKDPTRLMELQVIEVTKDVIKENEVTKEAVLTIPYVTKLPGKTPYEKAVIVKRLIQIKEQFEHIRNKIKKIIPTDLQESKKEDTAPGAAASGGKAA